MNRRTFIGATMLGLAGVGVGAWRIFAWWRGRDGEPAAGQTTVALPSASSAQHARFPARYRAALRAMTERIMPDEDGAPGAAAANAWEFIDREIAGAEMAGTYRLLMRGAAQLDRVAMDVAGTTFVAAAPGAQDQVIAAMQGGAGAVKLFEPAVFVTTMVGLTLEGMFSDPARGGNREGVGWQLIGYAMHPPRPGMAAAQEQ